MAVISFPSCFTVMLLLVNELCLFLLSFFSFFFLFLLILQMSSVEELLLRQLPDERAGECLTSHAVCIPQTLISDISGAVNDRRVSFFCSRDVNNLNQACSCNHFT